ncbi:MAG: CHAT domain-containing protein [Chloroflexota bacterium]
MNMEELLNDLSTFYSANNLERFIERHQPNAETISDLKDYSASFYTTDPEHALQIATMAYQLSQHLSPFASAHGSWAMANALIYTHRFHEADKHFTETRNGFLSVGETLQAARASVGKVGILACVGKCREALELAQEIEPILGKASEQNSEDSVRLGNLLMNKGVAHELMGEYEEALAVYKQQIHITHQDGNERLLGQLKHNQAVALTQIGAYDEALTVYAEADKLLTKTESVTDLVRLYTNRLSLLIGLSRYKDADEMQAKAEERLNQLEGAEQQRHWLTFFKATISLKRFQYIDQALLASLRNAQHAFAAHRSIHCEGLAWIALGRCHISRGEWQEAQDAFQYARKLVPLGAARFVEYQVLHGQGEIDCKQGNLEGAIEHYRSAINHIEALRQELYIEVFRAGFLTDKLEIYQDLASVYIRLDRLDDAFHAVEQAKARLLTDKLSFLLQSEAADRNHSENSALSPLMQELDATLQRLDELYNQARLEGLQSADAPTGAPQQQTMIQIEKLEQTTHDLVQTIQRAQPLFSPFATREIALIPAVQATIQDAIFLQYHILKDQIGLFVIDRTGIREHLLLGKQEAIESNLDAVQTAIELAIELLTQVGPEMFSRFLPTRLADVNKHLQTLYIQLMAPAQSYLSFDSQLIIAPDGLLHDVPFHALFDGELYTMERWEMSYTPNATAFIFAQNSYSGGEGNMLMGYNHGDLDSVALEVEALAQLFPQADVYVDEAATTERFLSQSANSRMIHLATHASFRIDDPMLSYLALANRNLTLAEIARLQLKADMVTLSGCETGHGQLHGADLLSLAGGFLGAGVHSLVVSLWRVEDNVTTELMTYFYQALFAGKSRAAALRSAQRKILAQGRECATDHGFYAHPAYWGAFVLIGNPQALSLEKNQ